MSDQPTSTGKPLKRALIIAGGGDRGAFAVGALREMFDREIDTFDVVAGTSTGGLIAPTAAIGEIEVLEKTCRNTEPEHIYATHDGDDFDLETSAQHALMAGSSCNRWTAVETISLRTRIARRRRPRGK